MIWELTKDWEEHWADWKAGQFVALDTKPMEELANSSYKKLHKMSRELKVSLHSKCYKHSKQKHTNQVQHSNTSGVFIK